MNKFKEVILNILKEAGTVEYTRLEKKILNKYPYKSEFELQDTLDILQDTNKIRNKQGVLSIVQEDNNHNPVNEVVEAEAPVINDRVCYLSKDDNKIQLNWYNPNAEAYEKLEVNNKDDTLKWLNKFNNPKSADEFQKIINNNELIGGLNNMNKENKTTYLVKLLSLNGFVICVNNNELYRFDKNKGCYVHYENIDYLQFVEKEISSKLNVPLVSEVVKRALNSLRVYKQIHHNILCFKNGYYNTDTWEFTEGKYIKGIPYYSFDYDYNTEAKQEHNFNLYWSNYNTQLQTDLLEVIGLLLVKGNPLKKLWFIVGTTDSGKTVFVNILKAILKKTSDVPISAINKGSQELGALLNSNINFMNDETSDLISNNSMLKRLSGNDDIFINPKYKDPVTLTNNDVPKFVGIFNNLPTFRNFETALKGRLGIIIMNTETDIPKNEQIRQLEDLIINESSSIEWLLYNSLESAKKVLTDKSYKPNWDMTYKDNEQLNNILVKYGQPIRYFIEKGFTFIGDYSNFNHMQSSNNDCFISNKDMNKASELERVQIPERTNKGNVKPKVIIGFINDIFGITGYNLKNKYIGGKTTRGYYDLQPTQYYYDVLKGQIEF